MERHNVTSADDQQRADHFPAGSKFRIQVSKRKFDLPGITGLNGVQPLFASAGFIIRDVNEAVPARQVHDVEAQLTHRFDHDISGIRAVLFLKIPT